MAHRNRHAKLVRVRRLDLGGDGGGFPSEPRLAFGLAAGRQRQFTHPARIRIPVSGSEDFRHAVVAIGENFLLRRVRLLGCGAAKRMRSAGERKKTLRLVLSGERISGKSTMLLQAMAFGLLNQWVVINIPEGPPSPP